MQGSVKPWQITLLSLPPWLRYDPKYMFCFTIIRNELKLKATKKILRLRGAIRNERPTSYGYLRCMGSHVRHESGQTRAEGGSIYAVSSRNRIIPATGTYTRGNRGH